MKDPKLTLRRAVMAVNNLDIALGTIELIVKHEPSLADEAAALVAAIAAVFEKATDFAANVQIAIEEGH